MSWLVPTASYWSYSGWALAVKSGKPEEPLRWSLQRCRGCSQGEDPGLVVSTLGEDTWPQSSTQGGHGASYTCEVSAGRCPNTSPETAGGIPPNRPGWAMARGTWQGVISRLFTMAEFWTTYFSLRTMHQIERLFSYCQALRHSCHLVLFYLGLLFAGNDLALQVDLMIFTPGLKGN